MGRSSAAAYRCIVETLCRDCGARSPADAATCPGCGSSRLARHDELHDLTIAHLDCDAFYAAIEKRDRPVLRDVPGIVGGRHRGVVAACCYVARTYGVHSAMPMFQALRACPEAAVRNRRQRGQRKPETFDFLGFTHYCTKDRNGSFQLGRKPMAKRMTRTLKRIAEALCRRRHRPKAETARWLGRVIDGWLNYYAVPTSFRWLARFIHCVKRLWFRTLRRRSQKDRHSWDALQRPVDTHWPRLTIRHPWPSQRLAVHPTQGRSRMP